MNQALDRSSPRISLVDPPGRAIWRRRPGLVSGVLLLIAAFAIRAIEFGNPFIQVDETFYLLVGDRMLHGAIPYVDIWDRKPIGLFLIYAAIRLLGGAGIVQYQIVATLFAACTAITIARMARPMAGWAAATVAGVCYLLMLGLAGGMGGQSPVFYNLPVALAAWLVVKLETDRALSPARLRWMGAGAMLLVGLAMQIKYSPLFEGMFLGLVLVRHGWRLRHRPATLLADAALWIAAALLPTLAALASYAAAGHLQAFLYANFESIGGRRVEPGWLLLKRLSKTVESLALPLSATLLGGLWGVWRGFPTGPSIWRFALAWLVAAVAGYLVFGTYMDHYALPLMVPIAVLMAPAFAERRWCAGAVLAALMLALGGTAYAVIGSHIRRAHGGMARAEAIAAAIGPNLRGGCLYVYGGDTLPYYLTGACIPTRYAFPSHLSLKRETGAIGVDQLGELRRIMASRPAVVDYTSDRNDLFNDRPEADAYVLAALERDYVPVARFVDKRRRTVIYRLAG